MSAISLTAYLGTTGLGDVGYRFIDATGAFTGSRQTSSVYELAGSRGIYGINTPTIPSGAVRVYWDSTGTAAVYAYETLDAYVSNWLTGGTLISSNLTQINATSIAGTGTQVAAGFSGFFNVATPTGTVNSLPAAIPGASNGLFIAGTNADTTVGNFISNNTITAVTAINTPALNATTFNAGTWNSATAVNWGPITATDVGNDIRGVKLAVTQTFSNTGTWTGDITGNLSGHVASVVGAVGSVTGAVGSVTGNVGNVLAIAANAVNSSALATDAVTEITTAVRAGITSDHGVGSYVDTGGGGTGGLNALTITATDGSANPLQNAIVTVYNGNILIGSSLTDIMGVTSGISADDGTYAVFIQASGFLNFNDTVLVSGTTSITYALTAVDPLPTPSLPTQCTVGGYIYDDQGNALDGVTITIQVTRKSTNRPLTVNGAVIALKPVVVVTGASPWPSGYAEAQVDRTDSFDQGDVTYTITSDGGELHNEGVILDTPTKNFKDL